MGKENLINLYDEMLTHLSRAEGSDGIETIPASPDETIKINGRTLHDVRAVIIDPKGSRLIAITGSPVDNNRVLESFFFYNNRQ